MAPEKNILLFPLLQFHGNKNKNLLFIEINSDTRLATGYIDMKEAGI